jgi:hypothetical protein
LYDFGIVFDCYFGYDGRIVDRRTLLRGFEMREFLIAVALVAADYHDGQWSKWYRLGCEARQLLKRWYFIDSPESFVRNESPRLDEVKYRIADIRHKLVTKYFPRSVDNMTSKG